jgi:Icc-related predicted phosphoesterase
MIDSHDRDGRRRAGPDDGSSPSLGEPPVRLAAAADVHCRAANADQVTAAFAGVEADVDIVVLAGDLTAHGTAEEARILADAARALRIPVVTVLGNHDWHAGQHDAVVEVLAQAGVTVLERGSATFSLRGWELGIVGTKGFIGGFPGSHLPDFGEPLLREVYAETTAEVEALDAGLRAIELCEIRIVLLHYAPTVETLVGERTEIHAFLGSDRLAAPIHEHEPDLVLHGHAHGGRAEGAIGEVPVRNVSLPVIGRDFWVFELRPTRASVTPIH